MFARARIERGSRQLIRLPGSAVVTRGQLRGVFVVEGGIARLRWLELGRSTDDGAEVLAGIEVGELYVDPVPPGLGDGVPVEVR